MTAASPSTPPTTPTRARAHEGGVAAAPRRLRRFAVRGPRCPHCGGPLAVGEGARLCAVCGYLESRAAPSGRASGRPAA
jgi:hypothetical protein